MTYFIIGIIIGTITLYYFIGDINRFLKINSIITLIAGYIIIIINILFSSILKNRLSFFNLGKIINAISLKGINRGLVIILIGAFQIIISTIWKTYVNIKKKN